ADGPLLPRRRPGAAALRRRAARRGAAVVRRAVLARAGLPALLLLGAPRRPLPVVVRPPARHLVLRPRAAARPAAGVVALAAVRPFPRHVRRRRDASPAAGTRLPPPRGRLVRPVLLAVVVQAADLRFAGAAALRPGVRPLPRPRPLACLAAAARRRG